MHKLTNSTTAPSLLFWSGVCLVPSKIYSAPGLTVQPRAPLVTDSSCLMVKSNSERCGGSSSTVTPGLYQAPCPSH